MSTSYSIKNTDFYNNGGILFKIKIPKQNFNDICIVSIDSAYPDENEILINRNSQFTITDIKYEKITIGKDAIPIYCPVYYLTLLTVISSIENKLNKTFGNERFMDQYTRLKDLPDPYIILKEK